ncbi:hypothetical protein SAMN05428936_11123 [Pelagibacterium halotolerans]|nr:hypothetical protein SAMN05428936_11123 [Pelagibacterium halotolerans]
MYVAILSLDHARSTIADLKIAGAVGGISLGEVRRTLFPKGGEMLALDGALCTCGNTMAHCEFWGQFSNCPVEKRLSLLLNSSRGTCLVDSSKDIGHLKNLRRVVSKEAILTRVVPVVVIRRFSEWRGAVLRSRDREGRRKFGRIFDDPQFIFSSVRLYLRGLFVAQFLEWVVTNVRLIIASGGQGFLVMSNGDLEAAARSINAEVGTGVEASAHKIHILRGNRVRANPSAPLQEFSLPAVWRSLFGTLFRFAGKGTREVRL